MRVRWSRPFSTMGEWIFEVNRLEKFAEECRKLIYNILADGAKGAGNSPF